MAELQTGVGTVLRNKGIWLSNREDVVVGHYTPLTPPRKTNPRRRTGEERRGRTVICQSMRVSEPSCAGNATAWEGFDCGEDGNSAGCPVIDCRPATTIAPV